jgi:hypothetical protein
MARMTSSLPHVDLSLDEIRAVTGYAARCATTAIPFFTTEHPDDPRPREAIDTALSFAEGGKRTSALRRAAFAALAAAKEAATERAAGDDRGVGDEWVDRAHASAPELVVAVLRRYPAAPEGGGRVGELLRMLDASLRR